MIYQLITLHQARGFCPKRWQMRRDWTFVGGSACLNRRLFTPIVIQKRTAVIHQLAAVSPPAPEPERTSAYADCCPKTDGRLSTRSSPSPPPAPNLNERPLIPIAAGKRPGRYPPKECKADRLLCVATDRIAAGAAQRLISFLVAAVTKPRDPRIADHQYRRVA